MKMDNSPPRGTRDLLPGAVALRDRVQGAIADVYQRIETPALESLERLTGGQGGDNEKLVFCVLRRGLPPRLEAGTELASLVDLGLRFDLTVPLTRFYGNNAAVLPVPFRSFQLGPVWRAERPQRGRYRQFHQCDIDMIGEASVLAEVELIEATTEALAAVGLDEITVRLSDRRVLAAVAAGSGLGEPAWPALFIGLDKLDKIGWEGVRQELVDGRRLPPEPVDAALATVSSLAELGPDVIGNLGDQLAGLSDQVLADLETTAGALSSLAGTAGWSWSFDPTLARGMGYYTGQIFEVTHPAASSSIAGGGRYDNLIGRSLGREVPACGLSIGFERIMELLDATVGSETVALVYEGDVSLPDALQAARALRSDGHRVATIPRAGKLGAQLGRLATWGFTSWVHLAVDGQSPGPPRSLGAR
jgi:histidyl-tRNA synthetase